MPRTKKQFEAMREKSKAHILEVAMEMFATRGYHSTSINNIASAAGIAVGLIYNYYESKDALMQGIMEKAMVDYNERMEVLTRKAYEEHNLESMLELGYEGMLGELTTWLLFIRAMTEVKGIDFSHLPNDVFFERLEEVALYHFKEQGIDGPEEKADMISELVYGVVLDYVIGQDEETFARTLKNLNRFVIRHWEVE